jgi:hypothetical protein
MEAILVIFEKYKIWWPANSPDLSPIENCLFRSKIRTIKKEIYK